MSGKNVINILRKINPNQGAMVRETTENKQDLMGIKNSLREYENSQETMVGLLNTKQRPTNSKRLSIIPFKWQ